ncbi:MAG: GspE/PulE family protein, partial [Kiritimatiellia bacterium]
VVPAAEMTLAVSEYLNIQPINLAHFVPDAELVDMISWEALKRHQAVPIAKTGRNLTVALGDPFNILAQDELQTLTGLEVTPLVASEKDVEEVLLRSRGDKTDAIDMEDVMQGDIGDEMEVTGQDETEAHDLEEMMESAEDRPVIRMVNMILIEAVRLKANDIHIEPQEDFVRLRYRIDGVLVERPSLPKSLQSAIISRIKILSDLDIGEHRLPQDGRFRIHTLGKAIDVRVSILPTIFGGRVVMRTLDKGALFPDLKSLGLDKQAHQSLSYAISQPHGIILVTGPTGSGKTTTLYSCLQELNKPDVNIITCEDPVEYQIPGIIQVRINEEAGCTFAASLRAILRQDPDIVLIGEIRDSDTAEIAIKAALTGHLVLTTLHANDACGTITRLLDMGMEPFLLASSVILTQAQRLYRKLCPACRQPDKVPKARLKEYGFDPEFFKDSKIYKGKGCPKCHNIGYRGRGAAMEVLMIDNDIRAAMIQHTPADEIRDIAVKKGMITLAHTVMNQVKKGETSIEVGLKIAGSS